MTARILICDDDVLHRQMIEVQLLEHGHSCVHAGDGLEALGLIEEEDVDLILLDLQMPHVDGLTALRLLRDRGDDRPVLVMTSFGSKETALEATRLGAFAYLTKPLSFDELFLHLNKAVSEQRMRDELDAYRARNQGSYGTLVGRSAAMRGLFDLLKRLSRIPEFTVLIQGESGVGKDLVARAIHSEGERSEHPFLEVDCASLPENLIESELFGHEKGAFTDAKTTRRGLFEVAGTGTIFLDEIGELPLGMQAKLLRALENRTFRRVGGSQVHSFSASVLAATNRDLKKEVAAGRFREDLFFRLNVIPLHVPPLRERAEDVEVLADHFLQRAMRKTGRRVGGFTPEAMRLLDQYRWPGNVRELKNVVERLVVLVPDDMAIQPSHLPPEVRFASDDDDTGLHAIAQLAPPAGAKGGYQFVLPESGIDLEAVERDFVVQAMRQAGGRRSQAATLLGMSRHTLRYRLQKYKLESEDFA